MMRLLDGLKIVPPTLIRALGLMLPLSVIHFSPYTSSVSTNKYST